MIFIGHSPYAKRTSALKIKNKKKRRQQVLKHSIIGRQQ